MLTVAGLAAAPTNNSYAAKPAIPELPGYIAKAFQEDTKAWKFFQELAPSHRRYFVAWIHTAKRPETREKRIPESICLLAAGEKLGLKLFRVASAEEPFTRAVRTVWLHPFRSQCPQRIPLRRYVRLSSEMLSIDELPCVHNWAADAGPKLSILSATGRLPQHRLLSSKSRKVLFQLRLVDAQKRANVD